MSFRPPSKLLVSGLLLVVGCLDGGDLPLNHNTAALGSGPDLVVSAIADPPSTAQLGQTFTASETVTNQGNAGAGATWTKYYLSSNGTTPLYFVGNRSVGALAAGGSDAGTASVTIAAEVPDGSYFLLACADSGPGTGGRFSEVDETDELNNCTASAGTVTVSGPDLIESNVTAGPAMIDPSTGTLTVSDTVQNVGTAPAGASVTRWYLSTDAVKDSSDAFIRNCTNGGTVPGRNVGPISAGGTDTGQGTTSPLCVRDASGLHQPVAGTYYVIACADELHQISETNEFNNCATSSTTIQIAGGGIDLIESSVSSPPATGGVGTTFAITDTVQNIGAVAAPSSFTKFYLSTDGTTLGSYLNTRSVGALAGSATDSATTTMTITNGTPMGTFYVVACADSGPGTGGRVSEINESNEANNCTASASTITIGSSTLPDLVISAISSPPSGGVPGDSFAISDLTTNNGGDAPAFFNKYYLSTSPAPGGIVAYLATGSAAALPAATSEMVYSTATIPSNMATGTYYVIGCADSGPGSGGRFSEIAESNENNNCLASSSTIVVHAAIGPLPDLSISSISSPPGAGNSGDTFAISDTTTNSGTADAGSFFNKYYLSTTGAPGGIVAYLATGSAGALPAGASEAVTATATIPAGVASGTYFLVGCADAGPSTSTSRFSQINESDEANNCTAAAGTITVGGTQPDLLISAISAPPPTGTAGDTFVITDTTTNSGTGNAGAFFNKYYLSTNGAPGGIIAYLATGSAGALTAGTSETVTATASIPSVTPGTYFLVGCADAGPSNAGKFSQIAESNEDNNCTAAATPITIN